MDILLIHPPASPLALEHKPCEGRAFAALSTPGARAAVNEGFLSRLPGCGRAWEPSSGARFRPGGRQAGPEQEEQRALGPRAGVGGGNRDSGGRRRGQRAALPARGVRVPPPGRLRRVPARSRPGRAGRKEAPGGVGGAERLRPGHAPGRGPEAGAEPAGSGPPRTSALPRRLIHIHEAVRGGDRVPRGALHPPLPPSCGSRLG